MLCSFILLLSTKPMRKDVEKLIQNLQRPEFHKNTMNMGIMAIPHACFCSARIKVYEKLLPLFPFTFRAKILLNQTT